MADIKSETIRIKCSCLICNSYTSTTKRDIKNHLKEAHNVKHPKARLYKTEHSQGDSALSKAKGWFK